MPSFRKIPGSFHYPILLLKSSSLQFDGSRLKMIYTQLLTNTEGGSWLNFFKCGALLTREGVTITTAFAVLYLIYTKLHSENWLLYYWLLYIIWLIIIKCVINHIIKFQSQYKRSKSQDVEDMVLLPSIKDADICENLKRRFLEDQIFVSFSISFLNLLGP